MTSISRNLRICILIPAFVLFLSGKTYADHIAGGELTWECSGSQYKFTLKLYRFCQGIPMGSSAFIQSNSSVGSFSLTRISQHDFSPKCYNPTLQVSCTGPNSAHALEVSVYTGTITLSGVPPATGWEFYWSACCRPAPAIYAWGYLVDNLEPHNQSYRVRATMFPYNGRNATPCFDNSPRFAELPTTIICKSYSFTDNHYSIDKDFDSLTYEWTSPLQSNGNSVGYANHLNTSQTVPRPYGGNFIVPAPGFSAIVPLPWSHTNMNINNVPAVMDIHTGEISFTSYTRGDYATAVKVSSYRGGVKIAEIMRDIPASIMNCDTNSSIPNYNAPQISYKLKNSSVFQSSLNLTVAAGSVVEFDIKVTDFDSLPLLPRKVQSVTFDISNISYSELPNDSLSCTTPPCAYLDTVSNSSWNVAKMAFFDSGSVMASFYWRPDCNSLRDSVSISGSVRTRKFAFMVRARDNWCPAPKQDHDIFYITVIDTLPPKQPWPFSKIDASGGGVNLEWNSIPFAATEPLDLIRSYPGGPPNTLITINSPATTSYFDAGMPSDSTWANYFFKHISTESCGVIAKIFKSNNLQISAFDTIATLQWNTIYHHSYDSGYFDIFRTLIPAPWQLVGKQNFGNETFVDTVPFKTGWIAYKVVSKDSNGLEVISNIDSIFIQNDSIIEIPSGPTPGISVKPGQEYVIKPTTGIPSEPAITTDREIIVYPNPFDHSLYLECSNERFAGSRFEIRDALGKLIMEAEINSGKNVIYTDRLRNGTYLARITDSFGNSVTNRIVKIDSNLP